MIDAREIISQQKLDGSWGNFHCLSWPVKGQALSTEQALRRLYILGYTAEDKPIRRAIKYMERHLGKPVSTIFYEQKHDPKLYTDLMLAAWLRLFVPEHPGAMRIARQWAAVLEADFETGERNQENYLQAFQEQFGKVPNLNAPCLMNFFTFYHMILLQDVLSRETENAMLDWMISNPKGMSYVYEKPLNEPPEFLSRGASRYLGALEVLADYKLAPEKLGFAVEWLNAHKVNGQWDMGAKAKDGVYFPISENWRNLEDRRQDCTQRITKLLYKITQRG